MNLAKFPRRIYTHGPTPIERLDRLSEALDGPTIYIKRDDTLELTAGGNKTRKLEFLMADALAQGCDTVITIGAPQSNHCRLTLAAAVREGLHCHLILTENEPGQYDPMASGNNLLFELLGVEGIHLAPGGCDVPAELTRVADALRAEGRKPYPIPVGGSTVIGSLGYAACAEEILRQMFEQGIAFDAVYTPTGSAGTHGGLVAGFVANDADLPVVGVSVMRDRASAEEAVYQLARQVGEAVGASHKAGHSDVEVLDRYYAPGYGKPNPGMIEAVKLLASLEGILLDPVYTGKAMAGLIDQIRQGRYRKGQKVLFLHTGGSPALYAYKDVFLVR